jgi:molecular chaperone GrpE
MTEGQEQKDPATAADKETGEQSGPQAGEAQAPQPDVLTPEQIAELKKRAAERDEYYERLLRTSAEFDNRRKRLERDADQRIRYATQGLLTDLLPALGELTRAVEAIEQADPQHKALFEGILLVEKRVYDALAKHRVKPIETVGVKFDPNVHEAVSTTPTDKCPAFTVLQEAQRGWKLDERVILPARVVIAAPPVVTGDEGKQQEQAD